MNHSFVTICAVAACMSFSAQATEPSGYYSSCEGKSGAALLSQLQQVVGNHTVVSYDGLWNLFTSSDVKANGRIWDMYSTKEWVPNQSKCGNYKYVGDCYNREHSFPKSWFNDAKPMYSDAYHLYPTDGKVNGQRSNYPYGECAGGTTLPGNGSVKALGKLGSSTFSGYSGTVFEPDDAYKGDFARSYFYMAAAYNDRISSWDSPMLSGNKYPAFSTWACELLLKWHRQDPVSQKEIDRNEAVSARQHNRNPFIDHPELAEHIWGNKKNTGWMGSASLTPELTLPTDGTVIDLGTTVAGRECSATVTVKGANIEGNVTLAVSGAGFSISPSSLSSSTVCSADGADAVVKYAASAAGSASGLLTITAGSITRNVTLKASTISTLPAGPVTAIGDESFDATWTYIGDADAQGMYTLDVHTSGVSISGYPCKVNAAAGSYTVLDLEPSTTYTYTVSSRDLTSESVSVTTLAPQQSIDLLFDGELDFMTTVGTPSEVAELLVETKNISGAVTVAVSAPFEVSTDKYSWAVTTSLGIDEDRFYLRLNSEQPGSFISSITLSSGTYSNDNAECHGTVTTERGFYEDFETEEPVGSYNSHTQQCTYLWQFDNAGMWDTEGHSGIGVRMGKNDDSRITMLEDYAYGIGVVTIWTRQWSAKEGACSYELEYSTNGGSSWKSAGTGNVNTTDYSQQSFTVNVTGPVRLRISQTAGKRFLLDDIEATSYTMLVPDFAADYHSWDAYCRGGRMIIESAEAIDIDIYSLDGVEIPHEPVTAGTTEINLPKGLYIVAANGFARRVLIK